MAIYIISQSIIEMINLKILWKFSINVDIEKYNCAMNINENIRTIGKGDLHIFQILSNIVNQEFRNKF
jgi:hypothetical protein